MHNQKTKSNLPSFLLLRPCFSQKYCSISFIYSSICALCSIIAAKYCFLTSSCDSSKSSSLQLIWSSMGLGGFKDVYKKKKIEAKNWNYKYWQWSWPKLQIGITFLWYLTNESGEKSNMRQFLSCWKLGSFAKWPKSMEFLRLSMIYSKWVCKHEGEKNKNNWYL